ncbi:hypothetical protein [Bacteriovorax sp. BAL6_X]|uniref:hypothetical protein n=1 Tax=Bacteriovorax sp. BAL6_X TaxID=1201290 RepID=UPI0003F4BF0B|nr:hypothetical protein [Bacteriovorax sp. BAL6_X]
MKKYMEQFKFILMLTLLLMMASSCVPQAANNRSTSSSDSDGVEVEINDPSFEDSRAYIQYAGNAYDSVFEMDNYFDDKLTLRGRGIHNYVKENLNKTYCAIVNFTSIESGTPLVAVGFPQYTINVSENSKEYFLRFTYRTIDKSITQSYCDNLDVQSFIVSKALNSTKVKYDIDDICPTCSNITTTSAPILLTTNAGEDLTTALGNSISFKLFFTYIGTPDNGNLCSQDSQCTSNGSDYCCLNGQCVQDLSAKTESIPSTVLNEIDLNPSAIYNYPNYYNICTTGTVPGNDPDDEYTPDEEAAIRFNRLKQLYQCTTPFDGERGICTTIYEGARTDLEENYETNIDDTNFATTYKGTKPFANSVHEVRYQNGVIYKDGSAIVPGTVSISGENDNLTDTTKLKITTPYSDTNKYKNLEIDAYTDVSCKRINNFQAQCYKVYNQGQNEGMATDHYPGTQRFQIPYYANLSNKLVVKVDEVTRTQNTSWTLSTGSINEVVFGENYIVQDSQTVKIIFYVNLTTYPTILTSKEAAQQEIATYCKCSLTQCALEEVRDTNDVVVNYQCYLVSNQPEAPLQQSFYLSAKTAPQRYFDSNGVSKKDLTLTDVILEPNLAQEGTAFAYTSGDKSKPNNLNDYVGFNEIYGSFDLTSSAAKAAKEISVNEGTTYDIFVSGGNYSSCSSCGNDYYASSLKYLPNEFTNGPAGYQPDLTTSSRKKTTKYRSDDFLFGRACFVPATMLAWTHQPYEDQQDQRLNRMKAQHFMVANGYDRDWYGFNYGSVIGSFDGVKWFAVGSKRRIKASSNKLFLAINAKFSDQTVENSYSVTVQDSVINGSTNIPTTDYQTDGATCQQVHSCNTDNECVSALGWDYACENISTLSSPFPNFDVNGNEIPQESDIDRLLSLTGTFSGGVKRCVYRGRGAACLPEYNTVNNSSQSYTTVGSKRLHGCSFNNHCQPLEGANNDKFNNRISRKATSLTFQNGQVDTDEDLVSTVGLEAPAIGRPFSYIGNEAPNSNAKKNLLLNNVKGLCLPGRDANLEDIVVSMDRESVLVPDFIGNMGNTVTDLQNNINLNTFLSCPTFDTTGDYVAFDRINDVTTRTADLQLLSRSQNLSTYFLEIFDGLTNNELLKDLEDEDAPYVDSQALPVNACLRAPGSTCFTDLDCSASKFVTDNTKGVSIDDLITATSQYELSYWQTQQVCSQPARVGDDDYDIRNNRCCTEMGNTFKVPTLDIFGRPISNDSTITNNDGVDLTRVPGAEIGAKTATRFSGNVLTEYERQTDGINTMTMATKDAGIPEASAYSQFKALSTYGKKMCCSENWVRSFNKEVNGGGHEWGPNKMQDHGQDSLEDFKCYNYADQSKQDCSATQAQNTSSCSLVDIPDTIAQDITKWLGYFELTGIPNIVIKDHISGVVDMGDNKCNKPIYRDDTATPEYGVDGYMIADTIDYEPLSKANEFKPVFESDEFACCMPAGTQMQAGDDANLCCTGYINPQNNKCQLKNYANVSAYTNRYVSSELQNLPDSDFEPMTGHMKDREKLAIVACQQSMCADGYVGFGLAHGQYGLPEETLADADAAGVGNVKRFMQNTDKDNELGRVDYFLEGLKWNAHVYCLPANVASELQGSTPAVQVLNCN